jgi:hypothetical protein
MGKDFLSKMHILTLNLVLFLCFGMTLQKSMEVNTIIIVHAKKRDIFLLKQVVEVTLIFKILKQGNGTMIMITQSQALRSFLLF